jgi:S1-C subfamily serine protease
VSDVEDGSAADLAGILTGDVITAMDGRAVEGAAALRNRVGLARAGETIVITLLRDGRERTVDVTLGETPSAPTTPRESSAAGKLDGATFRELDPAHALYGRVRGVVVSRVTPRSAAARTGLEPDDVILAVDRRPVASIVELESALAAASAPFALQIARGTERLFVVVR